MKTFKDINALEKRLKKGICWQDWIKVGGRVFKNVEYGDREGENYMLFQNKTTTDIIDIGYQVPTFHKGVQTKFYKFNNIIAYNNGELYRY